MLPPHTPFHSLLWYMYSTTVLLPHHDFFYLLPVNYHVYTFLQIFQQPLFIYVFHTISALFPLPYQIRTLFHMSLCLQCAAQHLLC